MKRMIALASVLFALSASASIVDGLYFNGGGNSKSGVNVSFGLDALKRFDTGIEKTSLVTVLSMKSVDSDEFGTSYGIGFGVGAEYSLFRDLVVYGDGGVVSYTDFNNGWYAKGGFSYRFSVFPRATAGVYVGYDNALDSTQYGITFGWRY